MLTRVMICPMRLEMKKKANHMVGGFGALRAGVERESGVCDNEAWRCAGGVCLPNRTTQRGEGISADEGQGQ